MTATIRVICLMPREAMLIASALRFFSFNANVHVELAALSEELDGIDSGQLHLNPAIDVPSLCKSAFEQDVLSVFASLESWNSWQQASGCYSPTLYVHKNMAIMELSCRTEFITILPQHKLELCILLDDPAADYLPSSSEAFAYKSFADFYQGKNDNSLLITANKHLVQALLNIDSTQWDIFHPAHNACNTAIDLSGDSFERVFRTIHILQSQCTNKLHLPASVFDLAGHRAARSANQNNYSFFAEIYDQYMAHVDYDLWIQRVMLWQAQYSSLPLQRILEMACGTGNISTRLVFRGYQVDAFDLSPQMLIQAYQKPMKPNLYQAALTDPIPGSDYDLILCMFDSVNYLQSGSEIIRMLANVYDSLSDQGLFIFDISTKLNSEENFADTYSITTDPQGMLVHNAWFEDNQMLQKSSLRYFRKEAVGYSQRHETHVQRVYLSSELINLVMKSKLTIRAVHSTESSTNLYPRHLSGIDDKYYRLFFVLSKGKS